MEIRAKRVHCSLLQKALRWRIAQNWKIGRTVPCSLLQKALRWRITQNWKIGRTVPCSLFDKLQGIGMNGGQLAVIEAHDHLIGNCGEDRTGAVVGV